VHAFDDAGEGRRGIGGQAQNPMEVGRMKVSALYHCHAL
jgi:hypothetical protein